MFTLEHLSTSGNGMLTARGGGREENLREGWITRFVNIRYR